MLGLRAQGGRHKITIKQPLLGRLQNSAKLSISVGHQLAALALAVAACVNDFGASTLDDLAQLDPLRRSQLELTSHSLERLFASDAEQMMAECDRRCGKADDDPGCDRECDEKITVFSGQSRPAIADWKTAGSNQGPSENPYPEIQKDCRKR